MTRVKLSTVLLFSGIALSCNAQDSTVCVGDTTATMYETVVEKGIVAAGESRLDEAERLFGKALELSPEDHRNALVYMNLGSVQEARGDNRGAVESYSAAIRQYPDNTVFLSARAGLYLRMENYKRAASDYTTIIGLNPTDIGAYAYRGYAYSKTRELDKAKADFRTVTEKDPNNFMAALGSAVVERQMGHDSEALSLLALLIERFPDKAAPYAIRAEMEIEKDRNELAIIDLSNAIRIEPQKDYYLKRGSLYLELRQKHLARQDFEKAIELGVPRQLLADELKKCR